MAEARRPPRLPRLRRAGDRPDRARAVDGRLIAAQQQTLLYGHTATGRRAFHMMNFKYIKNQIDSRLTKRI
ncbi:hypothetical protein BCEP4_940009 [Burkholderia cepacia]|nr:hypothetical protein BCEP4_940009 [Burkholderia cepacia]